ncbi:MAG: MarC family protein, partial [Pseudomonas aeruginosa]|nr:MarC family protein [Pseudomonas aeruginosa]
MHLLFSVYLKMLVLYSPFFVLSCFISLSRGFGPRDRKRMAWRVALAALIASVAL